jgi:hypothetical protein
VYLLVIISTVIAVGLLSLKGTAPGQPPEITTPHS